MNNALKNLGFMWVVLLLPGQAAAAFRPFTKAPKVPSAPSVKLRQAGGGSSFTAGAGTTKGGLKKFTATGKGGQKFKTVGAGPEKKFLVRESGMKKGQYRAATDVEVGEIKGLKRQYKETAPSLTRAEKPGILSTGGGQAALAVGTTVLGVGGGIVPMLMMKQPTQADMEAEARDAALGRAIPVPGEEDLIYDPAGSMSTQPGTVYIASTGLMKPGPVIYDPEVGTLTNMSTGAVSLTSLGLEQAAVVPGDESKVYLTDTGRVFDRKTGTMFASLSFDLASGKLMNLQTGQAVSKDLADIPGKADWQYDPASGQVYDKASGAMVANWYYEPVSGVVMNTLTGEKMEPAMVGAPAEVAPAAATAPAGTTPLPETHGLLGYGYDVQGQVFGPEGASGFMYDSNSDQIYDPNDGAVRDPATGEWAVPVSSAPTAMPAAKPVAPPIAPAAIPAAKPVEGVADEDEVFADFF